MRWLQEGTGVLTTISPFRKELKNIVFCLENSCFFAIQSLQFSRWHSKTLMKVNCSTHCSFTALNSYTCMQTVFWLFSFLCFYSICSLTISFPPKRNYFRKGTGIWFFFCYFCDMWWWPRGGNKDHWIFCMSSQFCQNKKPLLSRWGPVSKWVRCSLFPCICCFRS